MCDIGHFWLGYLILYESVFYVKNYLNGKKQKTNKQTKQLTNLIANFCNLLDFK